MIEIDVALVILLIICTMRGLWRGFWRESFAFFALLAGLLAALRFADAGAAVLASRVELAALSVTARAGIAFVVIFFSVNILVNVLGLLCDRWLGRGRLRYFSRVGGALFALGKGSAVLAFVLLFLHLFPVMPGLDRQIMDSRIARPLVSAAGTVLRSAGREPAPPSSTLR